MCRSSLENLPVLRVALAENLPIFREYSRKIYRFFIYFRNPKLLKSWKNGPMFRDILYRMWPMFGNFLWKSDPLERCISICFNMRVPPCLLGNKKARVLLNFFDVYISWLLPTCKTNKQTDKQTNIHIVSLSFFSNDTFVAFLTLCTLCLMHGALWYVFYFSKWQISITCFIIYCHRLTTSN